MKKRISLLFMVLILLFPTVLAGCNNDASDGSATQPPEVETDGPLAYLDTLPENTYGYTEVRALAYETNCIPDAIAVDASTVDRALYERDTVVEERYNIDIVYTPTTAKFAVDTMRRSVSAGDNEFNVFLYQAQELMSLASENCLQDLNQVGNMDLSQEWWNQSLKQNLELKGKLFCTAGQYSQWYFGAPMAMAYNKKIASDYGIDTIDALVDSGDWTYAEFLKICTDKNITLDKDDNGVMDVKDQYMISAFQPVLYGLFAGAGGNFATVNKETYEISVNIANDISIQRLDEIIKVFNSSTTYYGSNIQDTEKVFMEGNALFFYAPLGYMADFLDVTFDYGIIPTPKYSDLQKDYISCANPQSNFCLAIPFGLSEEETDFVGLIMEAYNYTSSEIVKPVKYDSFMKYRVAEDPKSSERLDQMFESLYFDINLVMDFGKTRTLINQTLFNETTGRYSSAVKASAALIESDIQKLIGVSSGT